MKLTGKCKVDFEKWYIDFFADEDYLYYFNKCGHPSEQYGVSVDFFDSVGINLEVNKSRFISMYYVYVNMKTVPTETVKTRPEARNSAIEKANEIYNSIK